MLTPTGYRCKECVRGQQKVFDTAQWSDYPLAMVIAAVFSLHRQPVVGQHVGFLDHLRRPLAGVIIAEAVRLVVPQAPLAPLCSTAAVGAVIVGCLPLHPATPCLIGILLV